MKKRGISPLIATVLLIGFTIALAVIIFFWASSFIEERAGKTAELVEADVTCATGVELGVQQACVDTSGVHFTLENKRDADINGFVIRLEDSSGLAEVLEVNQELKSLEAGILNLEPQQVTLPETAFIVPKLVIGGKLNLCQEKSIEVFITQGC